MKKLIIATGLLMATSAYAQTEVLTGVTRGKDYGVVYPPQNPDRNRNKSKQSQL